MGDDEKFDPGPLANDKPARPPIAPLLDVELADARIRAEHEAERFGYLVWLRLLARLDRAEDRLRVAEDVAEAAQRWNDYWSNPNADGTVETERVLLRDALARLDGGGDGAP